MPQRMPNIIVIVSDDQGAWALGCAGNREVRTPNLDRLAASGTRFSNFFCVSPVCSPARASILTGRIPSQHGVHDWLRAGNLAAKNIPAGMNTEGIPYPESGAIDYLAGQTLYTDILADNGYDCALSGKWHLGDNAAPRRGFTHWYAHASGGSNYYNAPMVRDGNLYREPRYVTDAITDDAVSFISSLEHASRPFYLHLCYTAPHSPWNRENHPGEYQKLYDDCPFISAPDMPAHPFQANMNAPKNTAERRAHLTGYYAAITAMDAGIGRVLDTLERLGMRNDTFIMFTSDNGMNMGHHGVWGKGNGTFPMNMYDTSVKVPVIMSHPSRMPSGVVCSEMVSHYDVMPTLMEYLGFDHPSAASLPGRSFSRILDGMSAPAREHVVVFDEYGPVRMIRSRDWKYVRRFPYGPDELYDLVNDPDERDNLIDDVSRRARAAEMRGEMDAWFARYVNPAIDSAREGVTGKGQIERAGLWAKGRANYEPGNVTVKQFAQGSAS